MNRVSGETLSPSQRNTRNSAAYVGEHDLEGPCPLHKGAWGGAPPDPPPTPPSRRGSASGTGASLLLVLLFSGLCMSACGGTQPGVDPSALDIHHEMDVLYVCTLQDWMAQEIVLASRERERRRLLSAWEYENDARMRWYAQVIMHPNYGPGLTIQRQKHVWRGTSGEPDANWEGLVRPLRIASENDQGWFVAPRTDDAIRAEQQMSERILRCWEHGR